MGQRHFKAYEKIGVEVVAIADLYSEKIKETLPGFPENHIYKDYRDLFEKEDIDVVSVVTNGPTHAQVTIVCLGSGNKEYHVRKTDGNQPFGCRSNYQNNNKKQNPVSGESYTAAQRQLRPVERDNQQWSHWRCPAPVFQLRINRHR